MATRLPGERDGRVGRRPRTRRRIVLERLEGRLLQAAGPVVNLGASPAPVAMVGDLAPGAASSSPKALVDAGGTLYFLAMDGKLNFPQLWASDGTAAGTRVVAPGLEASSPAALGGGVAFTAFDPAANKFGVYLTDGTAAGTHRVAILPPSDSQPMTVVGATAFFEIFDFNAGQNELWKTDGTTAGTGEVAPVAFSLHFTASGGRLFFTSSDPAHGTELWTSDGTAAGTKLVADIRPGAGSSNPGDLTDVGGTLFFTASDGTASSPQLWASDGTAAGTHKVAPGLTPEALVNFGGALLFVATDSQGHSGFWTSDGTAAGTREVAALPDVEPDTLVVAGGTAFLTLFNDDTDNLELWKTDGTAAGTGQLATLQDELNLTASGSRAYFVATDAAHGYELWSSDGTPGGTGPVADIRPGPADSDPHDLTDLGGTLYFGANDGTHGDELWKANPPLPPTPTTIAEGGTFTASGSFSEADSAGPWTATVDYGDGTGQQPLALNPDKTFVLSHPYQDNGAFTIRVTVTDASNASGSGTLAVTVQNVSPTATLTGGTFDEGSPGLVRFSNVFDPSPVDVAAGLLFSYDFGNTGTFQVVGSPSPTSVVPASYLADGPGELLVRARVQDKDGGFTDYTTAINIRNVAPTPAIAGAPVSSPEGTPIRLTATATDPGLVDTAAGFSFAWTVTRGGLPFASGTGPNLSFTPDDDGTYAVTLSATDKDGGTASATATIAVTEVAPTAVLTGGAFDEGSPGSVSFSNVFDPSPVDTAAGFRFSYDFGNTGTFQVVDSTSPTVTVPASYLADGPGALTVRARVEDKDGGFTDYTTTVVVRDVAPTPTIAGAPASSPEGTPISLTAGATDPSPVDTAAGFTYSWVVTRGGLPFASGTGPNLSFTPDDDGTYAVTLSATDKDGGTSSITTSIAVFNVSPTAVLTGGTFDEGSTGSVSFSGVFDPSPADTAAGFRYSYDFGNTGAFQVVDSPSPSAAVPASFLADGPSSLLVRARVQDKDGGFTDYTTTVVVRDVAPTPTIAGAPASSPEGTPIHLTATAIDPGPVDTVAGFSFAWTVTRDGQPFATATGPNLSFTPDDDGTYAVTLSATDKDGGTGTTTATVAVTEVPPVVSIRGDSSGVRGQLRHLALAASVPSAAEMAAGFTYRVDWGDGTPVQTVAPGAPTTVGHVYAASGLYTVQVTATDQDGAQGPAASRALSIVTVQLQADPDDPSKTALVAGGTAGDDAIDFRSAQGGVSVAIDGTTFGPFAPTGHLIAFGQAGDDTIRVHTALSLPALLFAGAGDDVLVGGGGPSVLVGGGGSDTLTGAHAPSILIGGTGPSTLKSRSVADILIKGSTAYDLDPTGLSRLLDEWARTDLTASGREADLQNGGGLNGPYVLNGTTVIAARAADVLIGVHGDDWVLPDTLMSAASLHPRKHGHAPKGCN
jgi:ELWxxDGT repeat protein